MVAQPLDTLEPATPQARLEGVPFRREAVLASRLEIGPAYQRSIDPRWVKRLAADFDPFLLDDLLVNKTADGRYVVMDGQHRLEAIRAIGWSDQRVPCAVYDDLPLELQAKRFNVQAIRKPLSTQQRFRAALFARQPDETTVAEIVKAAGFALNLDDGRHEGGRISAVGSLLWLHRNYRGDVLTQTLSVIAEGFGQDLGPDAAILRGIGRFVMRFRGEFDRRRLLDVLSRLSQGSLAADGGDAARVLGKSNSDGVAYAVWKAYNHRLGDDRRLPDFAAGDGRKHRATS